LYKQISIDVKAIAEFEKLRKDWTAAAEQAPLAIASAKDRLQMSKLAAERVANLPPSLPNFGTELSELERQLQALQSELQAATSQRAKAEETINQRDKRTQRISESISRIKREN
jgi:chromosome segregation ATPase